MASRPKFAATVADTGLVMLSLGVVVLAALVLPMLILGLFVLRMPYDEVAGACGNPAILAYANKLTLTDRPDIGYAVIFPSITILQIRGHRPGIDVKKHMSSLTPLDPGLATSTQPGAEWRRATWVRT